jgi:hypothetical protein
MSVKSTRSKSPKILPRQLMSEEIEALRLDMRCRYIDNMKVLEILVLSHPEQAVPSQR